jgi:hypothetical protein
MTCPTPLPITKDSVPAGVPSRASCHVRLPPSSRSAPPTAGSPSLRSSPNVEAFTLQIEVYEATSYVRDSNTCPLPSLDAYIQNNPWVADNLTALVAGLQTLAKEGKALSVVSEVYWGAVRRIPPGAFCLGGARLSGRLPHLRASSGDSRGALPCEPVRPGTCASGNRFLKLSLAKGFRSLARFNA